MISDNEATDQRIPAAAETRKPAVVQNHILAFASAWRTTAEVAARLDITPSAALGRLTRLESNGLIVRRKREVGKAEMRKPGSFAFTSLGRWATTGWEWKAN